MWQGPLNPKEEKWTSQRKEDKEEKGEKKGIRDRNMGKQERKKNKRTKGVKDDDV